MNLLCLLFGHQPPTYAKKGWYSPGEEYSKLLIGPTDGIGRTHASVFGKCARCKKEFKICRVHLPSTDKKLESK